jgi:hypothetical protein
MDLTKFNMLMIMAIAAIRTFFYNFATSMISNSLIKDELYRTPKRNPFLVFLLLCLFFLTTCPIKGTFNLLFFNNNGIENFGLNNQKNMSENQYRSENSERCLSPGQVIEKAVSLREIQRSLPIFLPGLLFFFLLPGSSLRSLFRHFNTFPGGAFTPSSIN